MESDVIALMQYLSLPKASIVGWSDGAIIGLDLAIHHPDRVERLVAFAGNYSLSGLRNEVSQSETFKQYFERAQQDYKRLSRTPTLVIDGQYDEIINRSHTEKISHLIPNAELAILPGVSHFAMFQDPDAFNKVVLKFLDGAGEMVRP
jgi:pimeloyl-ACP methyl ester carboxylesterase